MEPVSLRLPDETIERLDHYREQLSAKMPGMKVSRADVVREAVKRGLDAMEKELESREPKRRSKA